MYKSLLALSRLYSWRMPHDYVATFRSRGNSIRRFTRWFFTTRTFRSEQRILYDLDKPLVALLVAFLIGFIVTGIVLVYEWAFHGTIGALAFGGAFLLGYPFLTMFVFVAGAALTKFSWYLLHPKKFGRRLLLEALQAQVKRLRRKHKFVVVAVGGSVGKTSTKLAIADLLGGHLRVLHQSGNYNDALTVPLVFFEQTEPSLYNVFAWLKLLGENAARIEHAYPYDVVVVELGTDGPGQMSEFAYIKPDIGVLSAIAPEHMEYFHSLDAVALEELSMFGYCKRMLVNADDTAAKYLIGREFEEYSITTNVEKNYYAKPDKSSLKGQRLDLHFPNRTMKTSVKFVGEQGAKFAVAAAAVADMMGLTDEQIDQGMQRLKAFSGRMQVLQGKKDVTVIDDTYNASPIAVKAALDVLYRQQKAPQRIAILGSMNELGEYARDAHAEIGDYCQATKLDMVVTVGEAAEKWLAPAAKRAGNVVHSFKSPYQAGKFVAEQMKTGAVVLAKGSQNGVFAEEAVKELLASPADSVRLVRQSKAWLRKKALQFKK